MSNAASSAGKGEPVSGSSSSARDNGTATGSGKNFGGRDLGVQVSTGSVHQASKPLTHVDENIVKNPSVAAVSLDLDSFTKKRKTMDCGELESAASL